MVPRPGYLGGHHHWHRRYPGLVQTPHLSTNMSNQFRFKRFESFLFLYIHIITCRTNSDSEGLSSFFFFISILKHVEPIQIKKIGVLSISLYLYHNISNQFRCRRLEFFLFHYTSNQFKFRRFRVFFYFFISTSFQWEISSFLSVNFYISSFCFHEVILTNAECLKKSTSNYS